MILSAHVHDPQPVQVLVFCRQIFFNIFSLNEDKNQIPENEEIECRMPTVLFFFEHCPPLPSSSSSPPPWSFNYT